MTREKSEKRNIIENFSAVAITQIVSYIMPLISLPYLTRVLGAEKFGLYCWALATIAYFLVLTEFGFNQSAVREIAVNREKPEKINEIFSAVLIIKFILIVIGFFILNALVFFIPKLHSEYLLFNMTYITVIGNAIYPIWYYQGIEHMKYITFLNILAKTLFLVLIFIFIKSPADYVFVAFLSSMGFMISGILGITLAIQRFNLKLVLPSFKFIVEQFKYSSEFFLSRVSAATNAATNTFALGLIGSPVMVAYYAAAEKIFLALRNLSEPFTQVLYPQVAKTQNLKVYKKMFKIAMILLVGLVFIVFVFAKDIITIFYGDELLQAYKVLRVFSITLFVSFISTLIGYPVLAALGHTKDANYSIVFASFVYITSIFILIILKRINIYTMAMLFTLTEFSIMMYRALAIKRHKLWSKD